MRGAEILSQLQSIPTDVLQIAHEHHETCLGFGYPAHLKKNKINPLARVVGLANEFCNLVIKNPHSPGMKPHEAVRKIVSVNHGYFDEGAFEALVKVLNMNSAGVRSN